MSDGDKSLVILGSAVGLVVVTIIVYVVVYRSIVSRLIQDSTSGVMNPVHAPNTMGTPRAQMVASFHTKTRAGTSGLATPAFSTSAAYPPTHDPIELKTKWPASLLLP